MISKTQGEGWSRYRKETRVASSAGQLKTNKPDPVGKRDTCFAQESLAADGNIPIEPGVVLEQEQRSSIAKINEPTCPGKNIDTLGKIPIWAQGPFGPRAHLGAGPI